LPEFCILFDDAVSDLGYIVKMNDSVVMNNEYIIWPNLRYYPVIFLEGDLKMALPY
jgi:hypothetical protein